VSRAGHPYVGHQGIREYWLDAEWLWRELELVPIDFELIGRTVVVLGEVQGDVDVLVRVSPTQFETAVQCLRRLYAVHQPHNWTPTRQLRRRRGG
jgi:hypothetical protein